MSTRRGVLEMGALGALSPLLAPRASVSGFIDVIGERPMLHTALCDLLGTEYPIIQAPMQPVATPQLVAAVCEAGGFGILPGVGLPPDRLRANIRRVRELTRRPFGVNLILHSALRPPVDAATLTDQTVRSVQTALNRFRTRLGLASTFERPRTVPDAIGPAFQVIVEERVALFSTGLGLPSAEMVARCHESGIKVMSMIATVPDAREAASLGVDIVAAQGSEAGGHRSLGSKPVTPEHAAIGTLALVPQVARAVVVPVVAAGGIMDGRGLMASLMLGARGVLMGTRFIAAQESGADAFYKQALVDGDSDQTTLSDAFTGHYARFLRNAYIEEYRSSGAPVFPAVLQQVAAADITAAAASKKERELYPLYAGQGVGMIDDVPSAGEIVRSVVAEARRLATDLRSIVRVSA